MYEPFVDYCAARPEYALLQRAYTDYRQNSKPCRRGALNQCAVRMSIALGRSGFGLEGFTPATRLHDGGDRCHTDGMPHVMGARELADWLRRTLGTPLILPAPADHEHGGRGRGTTSAYDTIRGQRGILFLNNCFRRQGSDTWAGDHIDLFDGERYYNQINNAQAGGNEREIDAHAAAAANRMGGLFRTADQVWFWRLA